MHRTVTHTTLAAAALAASGVLMLTGCGGSSSSSSANTSTSIAVQSASPDQGGTGTSTDTSTGTATGQDSNGSGTGSSGTSTSTTSTSTTSTSTGGGSSQASATSTTSSSHAAATPVTLDNLPGASVFRLPGSFYDRASTGDSGAGSGQAPLSMCQTHGWSTYHPTAEYTRDVTMGESTNPQNTGHGGATIASFSSHDAAVQAATAMARSLDCTAATHMSGYVARSLDVQRSTATLSGGQTAHLLNADYGIDDSEEAGGYTQVGIVAAGTHVELIAFEGRTQGGASPRILVNALNAALPALQR